ncbi:MAG: hypothetical protein U0935_17730 [Pirellulales bacterium]
MMLSHESLLPWLPAAPLPRWKQESWTPPTGTCQGVTVEWPPVVRATDDDDAGDDGEEDEDDGFDDDDDLGIDDDGLAPAELEDFDEADFDDDFDDDFEEEPDDFDDDGLGTDDADSLDDDDDEFDVEGVPPPGEGGDLPEEELDE